MTTANSKRSNWSEDARAAARARALTRQPWRHSTGPRSERGKMISAHNSYKHGYYSREMRDLRALLHIMALRLAVLDELRKTRRAFEKNFSRNELSSRKEIITDEKKCQSVYKPDSVPLRGRTIPLGFVLPQTSSNLPGPRSGNRSCAAPIWSCFRWGLPYLSVTGRVVRSYRTVSPLPDPELLFQGRPSAVYSLLHWSVRSPCPVVNRHRISVKSGLSSPDLHQARFSDQLAEAL